ncbi:ABC transporter substrate-binding protein [Neobacillus sp. 179-J 1A1 HS]|uniref:ABC transporter substrate-binding protein n=1 Tax=Neobacillus driksii TaxID=3035913 RepID=UPI0035BC8095
MKKRILGLFLMACLFTALVGCSPNGDKKSSSNASGDGNDSNEEPYTLNVSYPVYGDTPADLSMVQEKVNEITLKEINAKVEFKPVEVSAMANTYTLAASSGEKQDLIMLLPGGTYLTQYAGSNMIRPIDDVMEKHGKDIEAGLGNLLDAAKIDGKQYGIPGKEIAPQGKGIWLLDSVVKKYNIDITKIKTLDDLDPIFEQVHAAEPDLQIVFPYGTSTFTLNYDTLGNGFGVLRNGGIGDLKVVNMLETEEYKKTIKKVREWYLKGYISKDFATTQSSTSQLMDAGKLFVSMNATEFANVALGAPIPKQYVTLHEPVDTTEAYQTFIWAVPTIAERPDKSIQFLNLVFKDQSLATLLKFGIEGEHYVKNDDNTIDTSKASMSTFIMNWQIWGNPEKLPLTKKALVGVGGDAAKYKSVLEEWKKTTKTSKAFGFMFNPEPVKTEIAACTAISDQYTKLLEGGALDPDKYLKEINEKLYAAGLQEIIDEKQRQLDKWAKAQK